MAFTPGSGAVISFVVDGAQSAQRQIEGIGTSFNDLSSEAKKSMAELAAAAGVGLSLGALAEEVFGAQREFDKLNASLITATGSTEAAAQTFKSLQDFASTTPYSVAEATEAFVKMKNLGLDPSEKALRSYGNTAAAMGKDLNQMIEAVADASTGEFERLKEFGITASQNGNKVALTFKGTTVSIGKNADEIQAYLQKIGNTDFAGAMAMRANTLDGAISNLADKWAAFVLQMSQSGLGDAAKFGVEVLANNLTALAGAVATVAAAKLASTVDGWVTATRKQITETVAARAASIAAAEADVASTAAKTAQLTATQAMIVVAREEAVATLAGANTNIAAAQAAIAAAEAAGTQSFALRTVHLATAELQVAEAQRTAMLAELAILGRQQAAVSAQVTTALAAQTAAQNALSGATAAGGVAAGIGARAMGLLGGPIGAVVTVLGLAATAWTWYKQKQDEATSEAEAKVGKMTSQIVADLEKQNEKLRERIDLSRQSGMGAAAAQDSDAVERMAEILQNINKLKAQGANISPGDSVTLITYQGHYDALKKVIDANKELKETLDANSKSAVDFREKFTGVSASYTADLSALKQALDDGKISQDDYSKAVKKLATDTFNGSAAGQEYAKSMDIASAAITRRAEVQALLNQRQQENIQFLKNTGQIDESTAIKRTTAAQIEALGIEKESLSQQLALAARRAGSEKDQADLIGKIGAIGTKVSNLQKKEGEDLFTIEQQRYRSAVSNSADLIEKDQSELASLKQQTQAQLDYNEQIGLTQRQVAALTAKRLEEAAARKDADAVIAEGLDLDGQRATGIRAEAAAIRERAAAVVDGAAKQEIYDKTLEQAQMLVDIMSALDDAAQNAAQGMANAFGSVGTAIGGLTTALSGYERTQAAIAAQLAAATKDAGGDQTKILRANATAAEASAQAQVKSYGDMASAAKGFFSENSAGYKILNDVEKAYRAAEMAMALESMAKKIFFKETEVAANTTLNATKVAGEAASTAASVGLAGTEASAWGITAVVKAIASMPFPLNLAAGAATLAAVVALGVKLVGSLGGSGASVSEQRQAAQGTGTVLGDSSAKSDSLNKAIELTAANSSTQINYLAALNSTLKAIQSNITAFASQLVQSGVVDGTANSDVSVSKGAAANFGSSTLGVALTGGVIGLVLDKLTGGLVGKITGGVLGAIFGGKQSLTDSGFTIANTSVGSALSNGVQGMSYADIHTSGGLFSHSKDNTQTTALTAEANRQFSSIIDSLATSVQQAGSLLGMSGDAFTNQLNSFVIDIGKVSLKDMSDDEIEKTLEAVFSKLGDQMAQSAIPNLQQFQQVGEGYLETLVRVASDYAKVDASLQSIGITFGSVGVASIGARENLISLTGGIDEFQSKTADFASNFLTKAQQLAPVQSFVTQQLESMNLGWIKTREDFAAEIASLSGHLDDAGAQQTYAALMNLEAAFAAVTPEIVDTTKSLQDIADERKDLQDQLDELTMTSAQLLAKQRDALDDSNKALFDQVQAAQKVKDAQDAAKTSLGNFITQMQSFATTAAGLNKSLVLGDLSTLTPEQQYAEARRQFELTRQAAAAGDATAQNNLASIEQTFLQISQKLNGGDAQYSSDLATVMQTNDQLADWAQDSVDVAQSSLDALNDSNATLTDISGTLTAIAKGVQYLPAALSGQDTTSYAQAFADIDYSSMGRSNTNALVSEIKALRQQVADLLTETQGRRSDAQQQTGDLIGATANAASAAADKVVKGTQDAVTDASWSASNSTRELS